MTTEQEITRTLDAKGDVCPIPLAKTKDAIDGLGDGEVLEVLSTERNSVPDFESWADMTDGVGLLEQDQVEEGGETVYKHYVQRRG